MTKELRAVLIRRNGHWLVHAASSTTNRALYCAVAKLARG